MTCPHYAFDLHNALQCFKVIRFVDCYIICFVNYLINFLNKSKIGNCFLEKFHSLFECKFHRYQ